jgi:RNase P protein component
MRSITYKSLIAAPVLYKPSMRFKWYSSDQKSEPIIIVHKSVGHAVLRNKIKRMARNLIRPYLAEKPNIIFYMQFSQELSYIDLSIVIKEAWLYFGLR